VGAGGKNEVYLARKWEQEVSSRFLVDQQDNEDGPQSLQELQSQQSPAGQLKSSQAIATLRKVLSRRFSNIYEAFVFCDVSGSSKVTSADLTFMLSKLDISPSTIIQEAAEFLDSSHDGVIEPHEFASILSWHPIMMIHKGQTEARLQVNNIKARRKGIVAKAVSLTTAELLFGSTSGQKQGQSGHRSTSPLQAAAMRRDTSPQAQSKGNRDTSPQARSFSRSTLSLFGRSMSPAASVVPSPLERLKSNGRRNALFGQSLFGRSLPQSVFGQSMSPAESVVPSEFANSRHLEKRKDSKNGFFAEGEADGTIKDRGVANRRSLSAPSQPKVDLSWRRARPLIMKARTPNAPPADGTFSQPTPAYVLRKGQNVSVAERLAASKLSDQEKRLELGKMKRKRLFFLFHKYDQDGSGTLDATEVCRLLADMGHEYREAEVRTTLALLVPPHQVEVAIPFEQFCEWWECLDWFHGQGIYDGALRMALAKHKKELWVEELEDMKDEMHAHLEEQKAHTDEDLNTLFLFRRKYPAEDTPEFENLNALGRVKAKLSTGTNCRGFYCLQ
jgi:Ca2+-binding EF-hand superfamily protein